jgi:hypothetical protein
MSTEDAEPTLESIFAEQDAQIADLKAQIRKLQDTRDEWIRIFNEKDTRIAELEAERDSWRDKALSCPYNR